MTSPRWFSIAAGLLVINALAIITTSLWRHAGADEPTGAAEVRSEQLAGAAPQPANPATAVGETAAGSEAVGGSAPDRAQPGNPLDAIPIPELPEIPSLPDAQSLQADPGFQEFRRLFEAEEESWSAEPPLLGKRKSALRDSAYFATLEKRLEAVEKLCSAARSIASEAASQADRGSKDQSDELVRLATQLRDIAAKLLVSEM